MKEDLKNIDSTNNISQINKSNNDNEILEKLKESEPLFDLINQHKKRLLEIKEWQNNFNYSNISQSEKVLNDKGKDNKDNIINNNIQNSFKNEEKKLDIENIENNIKLVKDFLKLNSINKSNNNTENNEESSITINNINYNNIINTNNENNINDISYSILKESMKKEIEKNNIEQNQYMNTGINFKNKFILENIKTTNNYSSNNTKRTIDDHINKKNMTKSLEYKLEKKRIKIKNLKSNIELLIKENQNLKKNINELEKKLENIDINNNMNFIQQENIIKREQDMLNKINLLTQEITEKNELIEKMKNMDKIKIKDIQILNQKCRDLEIISNEINKEKIEKLFEENKNLKNEINNTEKIIFTVNYFIKKIFNMIPSLSNNKNFEKIKEPLELQKCFIEIENFINEYIIYDSNKKSSFFIEFERNKNYNNQYFKNLDKEREKEELEAKINEINKQNIILLKEIQTKKRLNENKKNNEGKKKDKKIRKINIKRKKNEK